MQTDVVIIGAGPAGIAAGIQLKRYGIDPVIIEKDEIGGLVRNANLIENYPGFADGITGVELIDLLKKQAKKAGLKIVSGKVNEIDYCDRQFVIKTSTQELLSHYAIIASGTKPKLFTDIKLPEISAGKILYEIYPVLKESGKNIAIIGAGDAAFDYALNLEKDNSVVILHRGNSEKCLPLLIERVKQNSNISYYKQTKIVEITDHGIDKLQLKCSNPEKTLEFDIDYLIFALGREPQLDFLTERFRSKSAELQDNAILYLAGDVNNDIFRQVSIAVGDGVKAAMKVYRNMKGIG